MLQAAHSYAQQRGICPITNRLMLAALLVDDNGFAARVCRSPKVNIDPEQLFGMMVVFMEADRIGAEADTAEAGQGGSPPPLRRTFGLSPEACSRIVLPVINEAKRMAGSGKLVGEKELFRAFCLEADAGFKLAMLTPPFPVDLDRMAGINPLEPLPEPPGKSLAELLDRLNGPARRVVETAQSPGEAARQPSDLQSSHAGGLSHGAGRVCGRGIRARSIPAAQLLPGARRQRRQRRGAGFPARSRSVQEDCPADGEACRRAGGRRGGGHGTHALQGVLPGCGARNETGTQGPSAEYRPRRPRRRRHFAACGRRPPGTRRRSPPRPRTATPRPCGWRTSTTTPGVSWKRRGGSRAGRGAGGAHASSCRGPARRCERPRRGGLGEQQIDPATARQMVLSFVSSGGRSRARAPAPGKSVQKVLQLAVRLARDRQRANAAPDDLFAALSADPNSPLMLVLQALRQRDAAAAFAASSPGGPSVLAALGVDLTEKARRGELPEIVGRDDEIDMALQTLLLTENANPLLVGEAGVGKTAIVEGIAQRIVQNRCPRGCGTSGSSSCRRADWSPTRGCAASSSSGCGTCWRRPGRARCCCSSTRSTRLSGPAWRREAVRTRATC